MSAASSQENKTYNYSIKDVYFSDGSVLEGHWSVTYDSSGNVVSVTHDKFTVTKTTVTGLDETTTFTADDTPTSHSVTPGNTGAYQYFGKNSTGSYAYLYIDWQGMSPTNLITDPNLSYKTSVAGPVNILDGTRENIYVDPSKNTAITITPDACFLPGTLILTPQGQVAVENIQVGDTVTTFDWRNNTDIVRPVVWVGKTHTNVLPGLPDDEAGYPVRVLKDAISDGVPYKDMLITPEHSLFFEDKFVPVRTLVNGRSIFYDKSITSYDYYHVETEQHSVIIADGMLTESYLDTGNRRSFRQEGKVVSFGGAPHTWAEHGAADLCASREVVEALFRKIEARAETRKVPATATAPQLTNDADLHLLTEDGRIIRQIRQADGYAMFMVPSDVTSVRIASRTSRPSDTIGPFVDDRRQLGVLVGDVSLFDARKTRKIDTHLTATNLNGWDVQEELPCRWTNGNALLPLGERQHNTVGMLAVKILAAGPYTVRIKAEQATARKA